MKKSVFIYLIILAVVVTLISIFAFNNKGSELKEENEISKVVGDSNLEILLNLENFASNMYSEGNLLKTAMMFAENNNFIVENLDDGYMEYINKIELHKIINELTNIIIEAPIQIEDFYFVYNSEKDYYYCIPIDYPVYKISEIKNIYQNGNEYTIECIASKTQDGELTLEKQFTTKLKKIEDGVYTKYQVIKQEMK